MLVKCCLYCPLEAKNYQCSFKTRETSRSVSTKYYKLFYRTDIYIRFYLFAKNKVLKTEMIRKDAEFWQFYFYYHSFFCLPQQGSSHYNTLRPCTFIPNYGRYFYFHQICLHYGILVDCLAFLKCHQFIWVTNEHMKSEIFHIRGLWLENVSLDAKILSHPCEL